MATNSETLLKSARGTFPVIADPSARADFYLKFWVDDFDASTPSWQQPYVRGLGHRVFAGFDAKSSVLADLRTRRMIGRFSAAMAADAAYWRRVVFPVLTSIVAGSIGMVELHASCVAKDRLGVILLGPSRSGKSTLAMALTKAGFQLLSDDRVFCFLQSGKVLASGLPRPLKLRREAVDWFEELRDQPPSVAPNGDRVFYCEANQRGEAPDGLTCEPQALIFLEQEPDPAFRMKRMCRSETISQIDGDLIAETPEAVATQTEVLDHLALLPCWRLQYGGNPQSVAARIASRIFGNSHLNNHEHSEPGEFI
ncbi:MAG TPA: hypothetical protein VHW45_09340 [Candidatus Sulfotelmatobacter sp.]|nr:hypothetical protein [Candidatus Sulfotelmatobacter sp.]